MLVLEDKQSGYQSCRQRWLPRPEATDRTEASRQEVPINLRRQTHQRMTKVDDLLQRWTKQIVLTIVARLAHGFSPTANLAVKGITKPPNPKSKTARKPRPTHGFLAKSNTCSRQITATDQSLPNSSRATSEADIIAVGGKPEVYVRRRGVATLAAGYMPRVNGADREDFEFEI